MQPGDSHRPSLMRLLEQDRPRSTTAIGERLELTREALGMSQKAFAERAGLRATAYANWKSGLGRPDIDAAFKLCDTYDLNLDWIYNGDASMLPAHLYEKMKSLAG